MQRIDNNDNTIEICTTTVPENILKKICKLMKVNQYSDAYYISYFIISFLIWYSKDLLSYIYNSTKTDVFNIGSLLLTELSTILPRVNKDTKEIQREIFDCIMKRTLFTYLSSFIGINVFQPINLEYEISNLINQKIIFVQNEIDHNDINIEDIMNKLAEYSVNYDNGFLKEQCPTSYKSLNNIIDNELGISIRSIKTRIHTKIKNKHIMIKNNVEFVSYVTIITFIVIILCLFLFKKTFVIKNTIKYFCKNDNNKYIE